MRKQAEPTFASPWERPEYRAKQMATRTSPEYRAKQSAASSGSTRAPYSWSADSKARKSEQQRAKWADQAYREAQTRARNNRKKPQVTSIDDCDHWERMLFGRRNGQT